MTLMVNTQVKQLTVVFIPFLIMPVHIQAPCVYTAQISTWHRRSGQMFLPWALVLSFGARRVYANRSFMQRAWSPFSSLLVEY